MKKPKLKMYRYLTIKIDVEIEIDETGFHKDKFFFVEILYPEGGRTGFAEPIEDFGRSLRKTFRRIIEELHLYE